MDRGLIFLSDSIRRSYFLIFSDPERVKWDTLSHFHILLFYDVNNMLGNRTDANEISYKQKRNAINSVFVTPPA